MTQEKLITRRDLLRLAVGSAGAVAGASMLGACGGGLDCNDTSAMSEEDRQARQAAAYVERSTNGNRRCLNCTVYTSAGTEACGSCTMIPGPINPYGYCSRWVG